MPITEERIKKIEHDIADINEKLDSLAENHNGLAVTVAKHIGQMFTELRELLHRVDSLDAAVHPE
jgi:hypothetical protein